MTFRHLIALLVGPAMLLVLSACLYIYKNDFEKELTIREEQIKALRENSDSLMFRVAPSPYAERLRESFVAITQASNTYASSIFQVFRGVYSIVLWLAIMQFAIVLCLYTCQRSNNSRNSNKQGESPPQ
jgi:hypothetical protein